MAFNFNISLFLLFLFLWITLTQCIDRLAGEVLPGVTPRLLRWERGVLRMVLCRSSLSSEESRAPVEEEGRGVRVCSRNATSVFHPRFANRIGEKYGNKASAANTEDLVKFAENRCRVLPDKGQEPSGYF